MEERFPRAEPEMISNVDALFENISLYKVVLSAALTARATWAAFRILSLLLEPWLLRRIVDLSTGLGTTQVIAFVDEMPPSS